MKRARHFSIIFCCVITLSLSLQGCKDNSSIVCPETVWTFPLELNGTMMAYDFTNSDTTVPWTDDMTPVFINYMARHGARYLSSEKKIERLRNELTKAAEEKNLSKAGEEFLSIIQMTDSVTAGHWGALNMVGIEEEQQLGKEMYAIAPGLLKSGRVEARATYVPRVVMTMYELCHELAKSSPSIEITTMEGKEFNPLLRYFKVDSAYTAYIEDGPWKKTFKEYSQNTMPTQPAARLFNKAPEEKTLMKLTSEMYGVLQSLPAANLSAPVEKWFSETEYANCWKVDNLQHYYQRSVSEFSELPARAAVPLLKDIVATTDDALSGKSNLSASLRFGHAETVIPLFALMRLPGCYAPECSPQEVADKWKDWEVSPLGANLLIVILKDRRGTPYAAMRLNGKWIETGGEKVVGWDKLRSIWISYMEG